MLSVPPRHLQSTHQTETLAGTLPRIIVGAAFLAVWVITFSVAFWALSGPASAQACGPEGCGAASSLAFDTEDLDFILKQIKYAERHAAGENLFDILPSASVPWGLRTVDGSFNNLIPGQETFGQADLEFPVKVERTYPDAQILTPLVLAPGDVVGRPTSYKQGDGRTVQDSTPRLISHLIVNQSVENPAAVFAAGETEGSTNVGPDRTGIDQLMMPNRAVDEGLSAPFNAFLTFFGQFFDHGLDLVNKGGNGVVFMPLQQDDPLYDAGADGIAGNADDGRANFMLLTRASLDAGPDGIIGTADDVSSPINATTPHVDQQQTYASHASSQILLRHYEVRGGRLQNTGDLLDGFGNDRILDTADDGGMATWDTAQAQGRLKLGIILDDFDGNNVPMIAADPYGNFIPGPARGLPQLVTVNGLVEGNRSAPVDATQAIRVNQSFFLDVAHTANPNGQLGPLLPDPNNVINPRTDRLSGQDVRGIRAPGPVGTYDDELLGAHFVCGDGRCNENIALSTIHTIFHREHNRLTTLTKRVLLDARNLATLNEWLDTPVASFPNWNGLGFPVSDASLAHQEQTEAAVEALGLDWNGERIFQAGRFGTEMQYNRIVFDEFAPTLAGLKDPFEGFATNIDPTISAEFSQSVYRFGHSLLTSTVNRFDPDFNTIEDPHTGDSSQLGLFEAFLNPLALYNAGEDGVATLSPEEGTGAVIRGLTRTKGNELDEFVIGDLQNNLVGLPLDLGAINIARGRDVGNPRLNDARRMFFVDTADFRLAPYEDWVDYADNLRHEPSLVNFVAAYGTHPTLAGADGIVGNGDDPFKTFAGRRAAACAIVGSLTADAQAYCTGKGFVSTEGLNPVSAFSPVLAGGDYAEDFNALAAGSDPADWLDTGADNALTFSDAYAVVDDGTERFFSTASSDTNRHSHYQGAGAGSWSDYRYTGRMRIGAARAGIGVTFLSDYPNSDTYYRLRRFNTGAFHLAPHPGMTGQMQTGIVPVPDVWYRFLIEVEDTGTQTAIRVKIWEEGTGEPAGFQINAVDASAERLTTGTVGVWSMNAGSKDWDDFQVEALVADPQPVLAQCEDGIDNDGDGQIDFPADPGCVALTDDDETDVAPPVLAQCEDGLDNDGDGQIDFPADPGCTNAADDNETDSAPPPVLAQCEDGLDNDGDGQIDFPADPGCAGAADDDETNAPPPVSGVAFPTPNDALDFLFSMGAWESDADGRAITGLEDVDFWNGGLAEERMPFGGYLGSTHNYVFETQIESLQGGDRFYYLGRTATIHLLTELESNSFTALVMRNTDLGEAGGGTLPLNLFSVPNHILEVDQSQQHDAAGDGTTADPEGDAELIRLVIRDADRLTTAINVPDPSRVIQYTGGDHVTIGGTEGDDTIIGGIGDDALWGRSGNDRIEGGDGNDLIEGGPGDDIITDLSGFDVIEGGAGNDAISSGNGDDVIFGDDGNDFIVNSSEFGEIFGGLGDDFIFDGFFIGHTRAGAGDDWMENLGGGEDLFQGDNGGAPELGEPPIKGNDVGIGRGGNTDFDMENGDDIVVDGPGIERAEGQLGFDWISFQNDRFGVNVDLDLTIFLRPTLPPSNDTFQNRYDRIEGISGSSLADIMNGTANAGGVDAGNVLTNFGLIEGLAALVPLSERGDLPPDPITGEAQFGWGGGEIMLGGDGSDMLRGEGGDDIIDGDSALHVALRTPSPAVRLGAVGQALFAAGSAAAGADAQAATDASLAAAADAILAAAMADGAAVSAAGAFQAALAAAETVAAPTASRRLAASIDPRLDRSVGEMDRLAPNRRGADRMDNRASIDAELAQLLASRPGDRCEEILAGLGLDLASAASARAGAEAAAAQGLTSEDPMLLPVMDLEAATAAALQARANAAASAVAAAQAQEALASAQAVLNGVDAMVLVPSMEDLFEAVFSGVINPGEISISRVIRDDDPSNADTDIAVFSGNRGDYTINLNGPGDYVEVTDNLGTDGRDLVRNIERLQFADQTLVIDNVQPINSLPVGRPTISGTPELSETLTASLNGVTDADNIDPQHPTGAVVGLVDWVWESELAAGSDVFTPIIRDAGLAGNGDPFEEHGRTLLITANEVGLRVRVVGIYQDNALVFETVRSAPVLIGVPAGFPIPPGGVPVATFNNTCENLGAEVLIAENRSQDGLGLERLDFTVLQVALASFDNVEPEFANGFGVGANRPVNNVTLVFASDSTGDMVGIPFSADMVAREDPDNPGSLLENDQVDLRWSIRGADVVPLVVGPTTATLRVDGCEFGTVNLRGNSMVNSATGVTITAVNGVNQ